MIAVRWYLRYGLSYRDVEELLAERGIVVDHVTVYRWVQRFTPLLVDAARPCRHAPGDRWFVDETYVKVAGRWVYLYRAIDQFGQVIDVLVSEKRDRAATRRFFTRALGHGSRPSEVSTDRAPAYPRVLDELLPSVCHVLERYGSNPIESDHGRLKSRLRPMRGLKRLRSARVISVGHAFVQNIRPDITNSAWNSTHSSGSRRPSPNSPSPSDRDTTPISHTRSPSTQQSPSALSDTRPRPHDRPIAGNEYDAIRILPLAS
jgi:transposase-like protein